MLLLVTYPHGSELLAKRPNTLRLYPNVGICLGRFRYGEYEQFAIRRHCCEGIVATGNLGDPRISVGMGRPINLNFARKVVWKAGKPINTISKVFDALT